MLQVLYCQRSQTCCVIDISNGLAFQTFYFKSHITQPPSHPSFNSIKSLFLLYTHFHFKLQDMCPNFRNGGLQLIMWTSRVERRGDCLPRPRDCHFIFLACVSKPQYETDWRQKKCLGDSSLWGWGNLVRFFFWGRQALYKHLFLHPSPTYSFFASPISVNLPLKLSSFISLYSLLLQHAS